MGNVCFKSLKENYCFLCELIFSVNRVSSYPKAIESEMLVHPLHDKLQIIWIAILSCCQSRKQKGERVLILFAEYLELLLK